MHQVIKKEKFFLNIKIPTYWILITSLIFFILINSIYSKLKTADASSIIIAKTKCKEPLTVLRENDYKLVHPILLADVKGEDKKYNQLKEKITNFIETNKKGGTITSCSVYFSSLNDGSHFGVNQEQEFTISRLLRIGKTISLLKQGENDPAFLDRQIIYKGITPSSSGMILNQYYSVKDLINRMIAQNDECVKDLLNPLVDMKIYKNVYDAIQNPFPNLPSKDYKMNVVEYSKFLKLFYNGGFLSFKNSEFMLQLLSQNNFNNGITLDIDKNIKVSHFYCKNEEGKVKQLHEFGIIYLTNKPYLLGVMTEGSNTDKQSSIIAEISKMVYNEMSKAI